MGKPWEKYAPAQPPAPGPAPAPQAKVVAGPWAKYGGSAAPDVAEPSFAEKQFERMYGRALDTAPQATTSPARSTVAQATPGAPLPKSTGLETLGVNGRSIQDEGREALQRGITKLGVKEGDRPNAYSENPDILGGLGDLLKSANYSIRDWWKNSSDKDKENLIASIPIEATGTGAIARLSDHIGQKTGNDFLVDKTGNFKTDASYDPVAELEMYALNAGSWSTRNQLGGVINPRAVTRSTVGPQLPGVRQALAAPTLKEVLPHAADVATNMTMGGSDVAAAAARGGVNLAKDVGNALRAGPAATPQPAPVTAAAANPSVAQAAPAAVPPTQPRPASTGQQPNAGNTAPGGAAPAAQPVLNATPVATAPRTSSALAKSDAKDLARMMRFAGVPRNDVMPLLADLVHQFNLSNDPRLRLKFFAAEYLPQKLPKPVADAVLKQFDAFGFQQLTEPGPGAGVMTSSIDDIRGTQKAYLEGEFDKAFGKEDIVTKTGKLKKLKSDNAEAIYRKQIADQQGKIDNAAATPEQMAARDNLLLTMGRDDFFKKLPAELDFAAKNEGFGSLWEYVHQKPLEAAHWMQSKLGFLERGGSDSAGLYGQMRKMILNDLEEAVPGYRGARMTHGDAIGQELAKTLGNELRAAAGDRIKVADLAKRVAALPNSQKSVARLSVKEMLKNEFRKVKASSEIDPATGNPVDAQTILLTQLQKDGMLDALETVFPGKKRGRVATDAIRKMMRENDGLPSYRSDTAPNQKKQSIEALRSPANKLMRGVSEKTGYAFTIPADLVASAVGAPPVFTASKVASDIGSWASRPNPKRTARTAQTLYGTPPANANALAPASPRRLPPPRRPGGSGGSGGPQALPPTQQTLDDLLAQYDAVDPGKEPAKAERIRNQIRKVQKQLAKLPNALASPSPPPVRNGSGPINKAGFGGSSLDMSEPARMQRARELINERLNVSNAREVQPIDDAALLAASEGLSDSEFQMWKAAREGMSNQQIADLLSDAERTVTSNNVTVTLRHAKAKGFDVGSSAGTKPNSPDLVRALELRLTGLSTGQIAARVFPDRDPVKAANLVKHWLSKHRDLLDEVRKDPSQSGSSKLLAGMGGPVASQVGPPAFAATVASVGPEGEPAEDKWKRMAAAAALTVGVRNLPALRKFASEARGSEQATFGGISAKTADLKLQRIAQDMERAGASRDQIWKETGWFKGVDGKWRFEIDDSGAKFSPLPRTPYMTELANQYARENFGVDGVIYLPHNDVRRAEAVQWATNEARKLHDAAKTQTAPLSERLNHPQLNSAYDLSGVRVGRETNPKLHGSYEPTSKMLRVADESPVLGQPHDARETALHETQHHVQSVEDFARGGNPDAEAAMMLENSKKIAAIQTHMKSLLDGADRNTHDIWNELMLARVNGDNVRAGDLNDMLAASGDAGKRLSDLLWESAVLKSQTGNRADAFDAYRRLAGETEARNVQTRRDFTPEERRARPPWTTQDVPDDQQIVRYGSGQSNAEPLRKIDDPGVAPPQPPGEVISVTKGPGFKGGGGGGFRGPPTDPVPASVRYGVGGMAGGGLGMAGGGAIGSVADLDGDGVAGTQNDMRIGAGAGLGLGIGGGLGAARMMRGNALKRAALPSGKAVEENADAILQRHGYRDGISAQKAVIETLKAEGASSDRINMAERILTAIQRRGKEGEAVLSGEKLNSNVASIKPPPAQAGFGGGRKPPGKALAGPPKKPAPVLSRAAEEATRELKAARSAYNRASNKWVMKDDRELRVKPLEERVVAAEKRLAEVLQNDARFKTLKARGKEIISHPDVSVPLKYGLGGAALASAGILGFNALMPKERGERPMSATDPRFYWTTVVGDKEKMVPIQRALREWGEWPEGTDMTGMYGKTTKQALKAWRYDRGLDPEAPMTKEDTARLLAGPRGYQDKDGKTWRYGTDGTKVSPP